jgi:hypothetical protein
MDFASGDPAKGLGSATTCPSALSPLIVAQDQSEMYRALQQAFAGSEIVTIYPHLGRRPYGVFSMKL